MIPPISLSNWPKFKAGEIVICTDNSLCLGRLKSGEPYTIKKQTPIGYVWIQGSLHPHLPTRFQKNA